MIIKSDNSQEYFCNSSWRKLLNNVCKEIDQHNLGYQVISPFGFELFKNKEFLKGKLRRLYCYIGVPVKKIDEKFNHLNLSKKFLSHLMPSLHKINMATNDIAIHVTQDKFTLIHNNNYKCKPTDKLIDIQVRTVKDDILTDYAKYIICTVDSILSKKDEPRHFEENKRHRCRTYQLYVMLEKIFGYLLPSLTMTQKSDMSKLFGLIDNSIQMFYSPSEIFIQANDFDFHLLKNLITPRVTLINERIKKHDHPNQLLQVKSDAYHVEGELEIIINKNILNNALNKIKTTYSRYS